MSQLKNSTLLETHTQLLNVCYSILDALDDEAWNDSKQVVYSTVNEWETAYMSFLKQNEVQDVKFPFATLTRSPSQESFKINNKTYQAFEEYDGNTLTVPGVRVRPVVLPFELTIYENQAFDRLEAVADMFMVDGFQTQEVVYFSDVLQQENRVCFIFGDPEHRMIPTKEDKTEGRGFLYSLTIPMQVSTVLGVRNEVKLISQIVADININNHEETLIIEE